MIICIYGGGVTGYCLAAHFEHFNIPYKIFTKDESNDGYGLTIQEADNILHFLQLSPQLEQINYLNRYVKIDQNENIIYCETHSKGNYVIPRSILIELFKTKINKNNQIHLNKTDQIENIIESDNSVKFNILSTSYEFDYLIGCDGIHSTIRKSIMKDDILIDTGYNISFFEFKDDSKYKFIRNDVVEYVSTDKQIRIFIKPNGMYGATTQIVSKDMIPFNMIPINIKNSIQLESEYKTKLYTSRKIIPQSERIILCGDSLHPMIPYHGSGANCGIINAHILAKIFHSTKEEISMKYYSEIDYTFDFVNESFNTFYKIHIGGNNNKYDKIYKYDPEYIIIPSPANYFNGDQIVQMNNFTEIILSGIGIETFPTQLFNLSELKVINLNDNKLKIIPPEIKIFKNLQELYLRNNNISDASILMELINLQIIRLSYNNLTQFILNSINLKELCLTGNYIHYVGLNCPKLTKLYCSDNLLNQLELNEIQNLRYFRISFNPIKFDQFKMVLDSKKLIELRVSSNQINKNDIIDKRVNIKYGCTLSKEQRKFFETININKYDSSVKTKLKDEFISKLNSYVVDRNLKLNTNCNQIYETVIKLNLLNLNDIIENNVSSRMNELFLNKNNLPIVMRLFTLQITGNVTLKENKITEYLKNYFNKDMLNFISDLKQTKKFSSDEIVLMDKLYQKMYMKNKFNTIDNKTYVKHIGYPIDPMYGRPNYNSGKCYYEGCDFNTFETNKFDLHLMKNVNGFKHNFHSDHASIIDKIKNKINSNNINFKCPVKICKYEGDMSQHLKELGFAPYWKPGDKFDWGHLDKLSEIESFKIYTSDNCMICMDSIPDVLLDCGHKVMCMKCMDKYLTDKTECIICVNKFKYFFII